MGCEVKYSEKLELSVYLCLTKDIWTQVREPFKSGLL